MRRLLIFGCGFAAVTAVLVYLAPSPWYFLVLLSAVPLWFLCKGISRRVVVLAAAGSLAAILSFGVYQITTVMPLRKADGRSGEFKVTLLETPKSTGLNLTANGRLELDGRRVRCAVSLPRAFSSAGAGDTIWAWGTLRATETDPFSDDFYGAGKGVWLNVEPEKAAWARCTDPPPETFPQTMAKILRRNLRRLFPEDVIGMFLALVTGDRSGISYALKTDMSVCGVFHSVAVSGMHVSTLAALIMLLCGGNRKLAAILGIPAILLFTLISGAALSTCRAAFMHILLLLAPLFRREYDSLTALSFALTVLLLRNPYAVADWGLQLSFLSTAGILVFAPKLQKRLIPVSWRNRLLLAPVRYLLSGASVSLSAIVLTQPLLTLYFGMASLVALPFNAVALWMISVIFLGGILTGLLSLIFLPAAAIPVTPLVWCCRLFLLLVRATARLPWAAVYSQAPLLLGWAEFLYLALGLWLLLYRGWRIPVLCILGTLAVSLCLTAYSAGANRFSLLDAEEGQCAVWRMGRYTCVVNCGGGEQVGEQAARTLLSQGISRLDVLVLTDFDRDHISGVTQLLHRIPISWVCVPGGMGDVQKRFSLLRSLQEEGARVVFVSKAYSLRQGALRIFPPPVPGKERGSGLAVLLKCEPGDILLTGDMNEENERALYRQWWLPHVGFLVGSETDEAYAPGDDLLNALRPGRILLSGSRVPDAVTKWRLRKYSAVVDSTAERGTITFRW